ncbi:DddA-like double-stranded DNA deaminase toxin [Actinocatenispora rupis]|uniref:Nucleic acid/nucleotide deaminase of polymorphic system toxin n=1 Tax=Actinocatenispora rupis TaxID=519421 RepID=A0A8J3J7G9_9ACTN|nr:DddA-like double-stranded DNA deaminase toxin [Actinocatenispora rupis]GID11499.1 hypothetical protein Aru02nite_23880 [Actinocatenispora rupis]
MTSIRQVAAQIRAAMKDAQDAEGAAAQAEQGLTTAVGALGAVVEGTQRTEPTDAVAALTHAVGKLVDVRRRIAASVEALNGYLVQIGAGTGDAGGPPTVPAPSIGAPTPPAWEPVGSSARVPTYVQQAAKGLPRRFGKGKTTGIAFTRNGGQFLPGMIRSGRDGDPVRLAGLSPFYRNPPYGQLTSVNHHVEGLVAGHMRSSSAPAEVVLVLNNDPCTGPFGCDVLLPEVTPSGSKIHIYVADDNGNVTHYGSYEGNGKGLR